MREDRFTNTEADAGLYERQRAQDDYDPPDVDDDEGKGVDAAAWIWQQQLNLVKDERDAAKAEVDELYTAIAAVKMLHARRDTADPFTGEWGPECTHCGGGEWPCVTRRLLDGAP